MTSARDHHGRRLVGIDLGTTNSVVAHLDHAGVPQSLVNFEGDIVTPSKLLVQETAVTVGREAVKASREHVDGYAETFKRYMGEDAYPRPLSGRTWRPEELSALLLRRLKRDAERRLGRMDGAVITVPAFFDECRRRATYNAAAISECEAMDLINEPTAAAIAYAYREGQLGNDSCRTKRVFVFDLGGGTMDATILEVRHGQEYYTVATDGEVQLGGVDWDLRLRDHLAEQFRDRTGGNPLESPAGQVEFLRIAEHAKKLLSKREKARVPCLFGGGRAVLDVDAKTFEDLTLDLLDRTRSTAELVLSQAGLRWSDIDTVLSVGGSTRMPMIQRMLRGLTGKEPDDTISKDEAVAHGAAIYAQLSQRTAGVRVINVNSHTYRVLAKRGGQFLAHPLIPKNSPLPAFGERHFLTRPGQRNCRIEIRDGESDDPEVCTKIGKVVVADLANEGPKGWYVNVKLICEPDGQLSVKATIHDPDHPTQTVRETSASIVPARGMSSEQVHEARERVRSLEIV